MDLRSDSTSYGVNELIDQQLQPVTNYAIEQFAADEEDILRRYFTNLDKPVFGLVNLPEVVKGALFARYSRTHKSLRRLFLDEFVEDLDVSGDHSIDATVGFQKQKSYISGSSLSTAMTQSLNWAGFIWRVNRHLIY